MQAEWKSEVTRLEEELDLLRSTASWAPANWKLEGEAQMCRGSSFPELPGIEVPLFSPQPRRGYLQEKPCVRSYGLRSRSGSSATSRTRSPPQNEQIGLLDELANTPSSGASDTISRRSNDISKPPSPTPQVACDGTDVQRELFVDTVSGRETKVSYSELMQLVSDLEELELALQQAKQENTALRQDKAQREDVCHLELEKLREENARLRKEKDAEQDLQAALDEARKESAALQEEHSMNKERHARDINELEGMLEPVMAENARLAAALKSAEAKLEAITMLTEAKDDAEVKTGGEEV